MKIKKLLTLALSLTIVGTLVACGNQAQSKKDDKKIVVGATAKPHAEILEKVKPILEKEGYDLEIKVFDDYTLLNTALSEKSIDANFFQHIPFLDNEVKQKGYKLTYTAKVHLEPMGVYSKKIKSLNDIKNGAEIAVPNDPSNEARALRLLEKNGLVKFKEGQTITPRDITENPKNLQFKELDAAQLPRVLDDVEVAVINTNYALEAKLNPTKDSLAIESKDSPYANILAVREEDKDSAKIQALTKALNSPEIKKFIEENYNGSIIPAF